VYEYPLTLSFKLIAIAPQIKVTDSAGQTILYVRQKALALREDVRIFADEQQQQQLFQVNADRWLDWSANYRVRTVEGEHIGTIRRHGMRSLWKATYDVTGPDDQPAATIHEESAWVKVLDGVVGEIPIAGAILSMFINPAYLVDVDGKAVMRMRKEPAFFEGKFTIHQLIDVDPREETLLVNSLLMLILLERSRG
jgi:uncharacterized protein YxjI